MTGLAVICLLATTSLVIVIADVSYDESRTLTASFCGYMAMMCFLMESVLYFLKSRVEQLYRIDWWTTKLFGLFYTIQKDVFFTINTEIWSFWLIIIFSIFDFLIIIYGRKRAVRRIQEIG